ncbi:MAG: Smr/MutS family protein [Cyclobacteriaceae bacterium]|nr:Smr/MutS family protein [Cyclobacteriaceae bacterium]
MNIGDRVRLLKGKEEGIVIAFKDQKLVEVEIEDGFVIPVMKNELVVIASDEKTYFGDKKSYNEVPAVVAGAKKSKDIEGIFLTFVPFNDQEITLQLVNNSGCKILITISEWHGENVKGIFSGMLETGTFQKVGQWKLNHFEQWPVLLAEILYYSDGFMPYKSTLSARLQWKASTFFRSKSKAPLLGTEAYVIRIDESHRKIDAKVLKEKLMEPAHTYEIKEKMPSASAKIFQVDLHAEALGISNKDNSNILQQQLQAFRKALDDALLQNAAGIKIIHGVGNGVLRQAIHKELANTEHIKFFEDADKEKFGFGATIVHFR